MTIRIVSSFLMHENLDKKEKSIVWSGLENIGMLIVLDVH